MDDEMAPDELRALLGAFALGALDDDERAQVEAFVLHDRDARAELHQLEHAVAWLGHASPRPSAASWNVVRDEMTRDLASDTANTDAAATDGAQPAGAPPAAAVVPITAARTARRRSPWYAVAAVAAGVALVLGIALATRGTDATSPNRATTVALAAPDGTTAVTARVRADGQGRIVTSSLPDAPAGHVYQLWATTSTQKPMRSAGLLGRDPTARAIRIPPRAVQVAISIEPAGGSAAPTTAPVAATGADGRLLPA